VAGGVPAAIEEHVAPAPLQHLGHARIGGGVIERRVVPAPAMRLGSAPQLLGVATRELCRVQRHRKPLRVQ